MPKYSKTSKEKLMTCVPDLIRLFNEVIKGYDCTIIYGHRDVNEQFELFKKGRKEVNGVWIVENRSEIVTWKDGIKKLSKHNYYPSEAIDVVPYPIDWIDIGRFKEFVEYVRGVANSLDIKIRYGAEWGDYPHYEVIR